MFIKWVPGGYIDLHVRSSPSSSNLADKMLNINNVNDQYHAIIMLIFHNAIQEKIQAVDYLMKPGYIISMRDTPTQMYINNHYIRHGTSVLCLK